MEMVKGAWRYRYFILSSIGNDMRMRVARSRLGFLWIIIAPLIQVAIYALILSALMGARLPGIDNRFAYAIYLMAGFLAWTPFIEIVNRCLTIFIENGNTMKKIAFPRIVLPLICLGSAAVSNVIFMVVVVCGYLLMGHNPGWALLWYPVLFLVTGVFSLASGLIFGVLNVFVRDVQQVVAILLQFGFWMTPIVYQIDIIPESYRGWLKLNPMYWIVDGYHQVFAYGRSPDLVGLGGVALLSLLLSALALFMFRKASADMVDAL